jgi:hypothetical protein
MSLLSARDSSGQDQAVDNRVSLTTPQTYLHPSLALSPRILQSQFSRVPRRKGNESLNNERERDKGETKEGMLIRIDGSVMISRFPMAWTSSPNVSSSLGLAQKLAGLSEASIANGCTSDCYCAGFEPNHH